MGVIVVFIVKYEIVGEDSGCNDEEKFTIYSNLRATPRH